MVSQSQFFRGDIKKRPDVFTLLPLVDIKKKLA